MVRVVWVVWKGLLGAFGVNSGVKIAFSLFFPYFIK